MNSQTNRDKVRPIKIDGRYMGEIDNGCIRKHVRGSIHMLRNPKGWAWDKHVIELAEKRGIQDFSIVDDENTHIYHARLSDFRQFGITIDRGYGLQVCLPISHWLEIIVE